MKTIIKVIGIFLSLSYCWPLFAAPVQPNCPPIKDFTLEPARKQDLSWIIKGQKTGTPIGDVLLTITFPLVSGDDPEKIARLANSIITRTSVRDVQSKECGPKCFKCDISNYNISVVIPNDTKIDVEIHSH